MLTDWTPLGEELKNWARDGLTLPLWWRDDDAVAPTPALDRLARLSHTCDLPVHLAVIPAHATRELAGVVRDEANLIALVHGWAHENHAPDGAKKCEFGALRPLQQRRDDAERGLTHMRTLFGPDLAPVFVPPWNRIAPDLVTELAGIGYRAVSTFTPRTAAFAAPGLAQINTHLDPINWKGTRSLVAPDVLIAQLCDQLAARRLGKADNDEPYGILTHHLVHDAAIWEFTEQLILRLMDGPVTRWNALDFTQDKETTP
ncbi:polysaccharide deacetylase family protein [Arenibacterium sp. CAU 1754]